MKRIIQPQVLNPGDGKTAKKEENIEDIKFNIFKLNNRPRPNKKRILIISALSEFGCELVGSMHCMPRVFQEHAGWYKIVMGWHGREYLYRHLADEFWEIKEEHQWLREYCRAFHHESKNLEKLEKAAGDHGKLLTGEQMGRVAVGVKCNACKKFWGSLSKLEECPYCKSPQDKIVQSIFGDIPESRKTARRIPEPSQEKMAEAMSYIDNNSVGIFARGRKCYGRNLQPEFYVKLISLLEDMGYTPIWLGEKTSTQPCPVDHITDFSRMPESRDLELTLAIVKQLKFTVQYWTASTRLAGIMGTPYILFESPDQIWGNGQEGYRRNLCDFGPSKLAICHYLNVKNNNAAGIALTKKCITEIESDNFEDVFGMLDSKLAAEKLKNQNNSRIGG
ncbi:MAG: hypothetical protein ACW99G_03035 [Candidatus Thorarchaeota archaeon]|jgi:hypothetical protein